MVKRKTATLLGTTATVLAVMAPPAAAVEAQNWGFVYADQPTTQLYEPVNQASSSGARSEVNRFGTGVYSVRLAGADAFNVVPLVTAADTNGAHCWDYRINPTGSGFLDLLVFCQRGTTFVDTRFTLSAFESEPPNSGAAGAYGYFFRDPDLPDNLQSGYYNSTGQRVEIVAHPAPGDYYVRFYGDAFRTAGGNAQVTATITDGKCAVAQWYQHALGVDVQVFCTALGSTAGKDTGFSVVFAHERAIIGNRGGHFAYLVADQPTTPFYVVNGPRSRTPDGSPNAVSRLTAGRYQVQIFGPVPRPDLVHVTVAGRTSDFCSIGDITTVPAAPPQMLVLVDVACYAADGVTPKDDFFSLNYYSTT